ncbi:MAG: cell division protein FtsZ [Deltaproteobacteria bacterium]|nr:cell division protein FtsZ [Deltaproteobacteria bacterium]
MANRRNGQNGKNGEDRGDGIDLLEIGPEDSQELLEFEDSGEQKANIKVIGVGGGGGNALNTMIRSGLGGVQFIAANTDAQALSHNLAPIKVQLGAEVTRGLGCGANPDRGRASALEARDRLREILEGSDMVFVTAGMGGGTGTGAAPIVAEVAREIGALTVGVVTKPFMFEGRVRSKHGERGLDDLHQVVDTLITIPNQRLLALAGKGTAIKDAFTLADDVLLNAVRGISDLITIHGLINLDFADVRTVMNEAGVAMMGTGIAHGDTRAVDASRSAISSPLLEDVSIEGARGVLINITGGEDMTLFEVNEASTLVQEAAHEDANIIFGAVIDETMAEGEIRVTVIATGLEDMHARGDRDPRGTRSQERPSEYRDLGNVMSLNAERSAPELRPVAEQQVEAPQAEAPQPPAQPTPAPERESVGMSAEEMAATGAEFASPFEDEYETPAFLRRRGVSDEEEDEREVPTFMRRAQD